MTDDKNITTYPSIHSDPLHSIWPIIKTRPSLMLEINPQLYSSSHMSYSAYDDHSSNPSPSLYNTPTLLWSTNHTVLTTSPTTTENTEFTPKVSSFEPNIHSLQLCSQETKKAHARFKSANDCLHKPKPERYQHFLSPPLPSKISLIQPKDNLTAEYKS